MGQKGMQSGRSAHESLRADIALPADRRDLTSTGVVSVRNVVSPNGPTRNVESDPRGLPMPVGVEDAGESERRPVIGRIGVQTLPHSKERPLPAGLGSRERPRKGYTRGFLGQ